MAIKKILGSVSPLAGAITGRGLFGRGMGVIAPLTADAVAERRRRRKARGLQEAEGAEPTMRKGGKVKKMAKGGKVRGCGCAKRGLTKGKMV